jgi:hypothetical protein
VNLEALLAEPIIRLVMERDGYREADVRAVVAEVRKRAAAQRENGRFRARLST